MIRRISYVIESNNNFVHVINEAQKKDAIGSTFSWQT